MNTQPNENSSGHMNENDIYMKVDSNKRFQRMPSMERIPFFEEAD